MTGTGITRAAGLWRGLALCVALALAAACDDAVLGERLVTSAPATTTNESGAHDAGTRTDLADDGGDAGACPQAPPPPTCDARPPAVFRDEAGCVIAYDCLAPACPPIAAPPASFCDGGPIHTVYDTEGCARGFTCASE